MANKLKTVFQDLDHTFNGQWQDPYASNVTHNNSYVMNKSDDKVIYRTTDKDAYERTKLELQQNKYLQNRWYKANVDLSVTAFAGLSNIKLMYRDADLMDSFPEIGAALDIFAEEATIPNSKGQIINVYSKSDRIRSILEDLFVNRLDIQITAPMVIRAMCKYGNQFMLLNIDNKKGVTGWKQLPVFDVERLENGIRNPYGSGLSLTVNPAASTEEQDMSTKFVWVGENNNQVPFRNWQIGHFRLLTNSLYLPYGCSALNNARRHWRMLSLMEDMMLIYRLERSVERRVYKIFVGAIDDADVQAYVQEIANNFKRTPIIDPMTGQVDLRKNILSVDNDIFIPVRDMNASSPIETLAANSNQTVMDDIKYVHNKVCAALRVPSDFINFEESKGEGKNLALMDVRFTRTVNRIQQAFLMEMTKIASIHLYLLGFTDELTNFNLSMNNPSTQAEQLEVETLQKKISAVRDAVSDPGGGLPMMSMTRALKEIMHWSDNEIKENFEDIRLEKALVEELQKTNQIIKKTGLFDTVDRIYGEPGATYMDENPGAGGGDEGGFGSGLPGGGGGGGGGMPDLPPLGDEGPEGLGEPDEGGGAEGLPPGGPGMGGPGGPGGMPPAGPGGPGGPGMPPAGPPLEGVRRGKQNIFESFLHRLSERQEEKDGVPAGKPQPYDGEFINEEFDDLAKEIDKFIKG